VSVIDNLETLEGAHSSAGRALEWHSRGQEFDSPWVHFAIRSRSSVWLERLPVTQEAASSSLVGSAIENSFFGAVAQFG